jgi:hypothetical protein
MYLFIGIGILLYVAVLGVLVRKYIRTRDVGFLWLGVAVILWPGVRGILDIVKQSTISLLLSGQPAKWYPANLVHRGQMSVGYFAASFNMVESMIGMLLLLIAVSYLGRPRISTSSYPI